MAARARTLAVFLVAWAAFSWAWAAEETKAPPEGLPPLESLRKARAGDKYRMLVRQIKVPGDYEKYGDFRDLGQRQLKTYAGFNDLPAGHWVYVYPYWYIWRDLASAPKLQRAWGPEQATGEPDTPGAGDIQTAWASLTPDGQAEWLMMEYAEPVVPAAVLVHETYNPGALTRVTVYRLDGEEVEVWRGKDPTAVGSARGVSEVTFKAGFKTNRVRLYFDSQRVAGWNEIDAVGLRDTSGKTHWAVAADASTTYAAPGMAGFGGPGGGGIIMVAPAGAPAGAVPAIQLVPAAQPPPPPPAPGPAARPAPAGPAAGPPGGGGPIALGPVPPRAVPAVPGGAPAAADPKDEKIRQLERENRELKEMVKALQEKLKKESK